MANSKYEYVKSFERSQPDILLPNTWIVIRIDGRGFHKLTAKYEFEKPNDRRALELMNAAAVGVFKELPDLVLGYGISDEYSFIFHKDCNLFERRAAKLITTVATTFTSHYIYLWQTYFPDKPLTPPMPSFDGRAVMYPSVQNLRDYMSWRQVDCHINNLYNTTFWTLIQRGGMDAAAAEQRLSGTVSSDKNEILFKEFGINYNNEDDLFKKGSVVFRDFELVDIPTKKQDQAAAASADHHLDDDPTATASLDNAQPSSTAAQPLSKTAAEKERKRRAKAKIAVEHVDIIKDDFWLRRPWILSGRAGKLKE
ncbi:tRNA guanylyltransferase protein [Lasiodiplodia theobromae]|uniref:tRNA(His) guanylyltransferase n=1 Tax=Lasiodiplodia theobromae TaxID=45133 RepID=A0A5N5DE18_9PEZI|nr:tRNA guanylyltransferase protein [Lasiodiplodia theobromae]KAB2576113.1 tRNA(His) guanylyltransferase [Lasiodiplodia theobromae]KAF4545663.1 tRNA guanylyltransferase protein [Lasiodiplodia theobromae]